ncbi:MAG TPA: hypothetical protein VF755_30185 [Catenuloplanes sp.]|jgi:hypothetical protein
MNMALPVLQSWDTAPQDISVEHAHSIMQSHLRCHTNTCQQRRTARDLLVREGRLVIAGMPQPERASA